MPQSTIKTCTLCASSFRPHGARLTAALIPQMRCCNNFLALHYTVEILGGRALSQRVLLFRLIYGVLNVLDDSTVTLLQRTSWWHFMPHPLCLPSCAFANSPPAPHKSALAKKPSLYHFLLQWALRPFDSIKKQFLILRSIFQEPSQRSGVNFLNSCLHCDNQRPPAYARSRRNCAPQGYSPGPQEHRLLDLFRRHAGTQIAIEKGQGTAVVAALCVLCYDYFDLMASHFRGDWWHT